MLPSSGKRLTMMVEITARTAMDLEVTAGAMATAMTAETTQGLAARPGCSWALPSPWLGCSVSITAEFKNERGDQAHLGSQMSMTGKLSEA